MMTGIHFLLTYRCLLECDHCFLYCGPRARGTMTLAQVQALLDEARKMKTVKDIYFEGGEPFLFYPVLVAGVELARKMGFAAGIVSNGYWATCSDDAEHWLRPLARLELADLSISDDELHFGDTPESPAKAALQAAEKLGMPGWAITKTVPAVEPDSDADPGRGAPEISGDIKLRGRAVEKYAADLPKKKKEAFTECPYEDLVTPQRVHIDAYGNVQICQGLSMGNCFRTPLSELVAGYDAGNHPICGPLVRGGPAALVEAYDLDPGDEFVDACHLCYEARKALLDRYGEYLAPRQVYGIA